MEWMYLAHINFRPVDYGRMVYSALPTPEHVRVRLSIPSHIRPGPGYVEFLHELKSILSSITFLPRTRCLIPR